MFKAARLRLKLTQYEVADKAGLEANAYARLERDERAPSFATAKKLAKVLNINLEDIPT